MQDQIKTLSHANLIQKVKELVAEERKITASLLAHLREFDQRKLYRPSHPSLFSWMIEVLGYSESAAARRIQAARLLAEMPELLEKIETGSLTLTTIHQLQTHLRAQAQVTGAKPTLERKRELVAQLEKKSSRQTEKILVSNQMTVQSRRAPGEAKAESVTLMINEKLAHLLQRYKEISGHQTKGFSLEELIAHMTEKMIHQHEKKIGVRVELQPAPVAPHPIAHQNPEPNSNHNSNPDPDPNPRPIPDPSRHQNLHTRFIKLAEKRRVNGRDHGGCAQVLRDGTRCLSREALEYDHYPIAYAKGGPTTAENLRLLCSFHHSMHTHPQNAHKK